MFPHRGCLFATFSAAQWPTHGSPTAVTSVHVSGRRNIGKKPMPTASIGILRYYHACTTAHKSGEGYDRYRCGEYHQRLTGRNYILGTLHVVPDENTFIRIACLGLYHMMKSTWTSTTLQFAVLLPANSIPDWIADHVETPALGPFRRMNLLIYLLSKRAVVHNSMTRLSGRYFSCLKSPCTGLFLHMKVFHVLHAKLTYTYILLQVLCTAILLEETRIHARQGNLSSVTTILAKKSFLFSSIRTAVNFLGNLREFAYF